MGSRLSLGDKQMEHPLDYAAPPSPVNQRVVTAIHISAIAYPLLILAGDYAAWLLAWAITGQRPVYGFSRDPTAVLGYAHHAVLLLSASFPVGMMLGLYSVIIVYFTRRTLGRAALWAVALVGLWFVFFNLVWWDPYGVVEWLGD